MSNRLSLVLIGFLLIGGFFLFTEHRAHVFGILPFVLLAACPLLHIFGHGGHGGHGSGESGRGGEAEKRSGEKADPPPHAH